jgi:hypothetical protein
VRARGGDSEVRRRASGAINQAEGEAVGDSGGGRGECAGNSEDRAAIQATGGMEAVNLKVAEQYVTAFGNLAKQGNTLIVPGNLSDMSSMIASALTIIKGDGTAW